MTESTECIEARNALIEEAERIAKQRAKKLKKPTKPMIGKNGEPFTWHFETEFFHKEMNRLAEGL